MRYKHSKVIIKDLSGKVIKHLDIHISNKRYIYSDTVLDQRILDYQHRYVRKITLS